MKLPAVLRGSLMGVTGAAVWTAKLAANNKPPIRKLVNGPAMATRHSILGMRGISSISETPYGVKHDFTDFNVVVFGDESVCQFVD
jgi:hypothetical protein